MRFGRKIVYAIEDLEEFQNSKQFSKNGTILRHTIGNYRSYLSCLNDFGFSSLRETYIGIYFLVLGKYDVRYVGQSICIPARVGTHFQEDRVKFDEVLFTSCSKPNLRYLESAFIKLFDPPGNETGGLKLDLETAQRIVNGHLGI